ncbi:MAG: DUF5655 domain-containing protein [Pyrinomonadaceae bacterium]
MATKTSGEIEKEFIDNLKTSTGKSVPEWMKQLSSSGITKRNDLIKWLKESAGFGHMNASLLAGIYLNNGKPVYGSTDDLLANQFAKAADMRPLYESFIAFVQKHFENSSVLPKKTYVSILEKREFAAINIKPKELRIGFDLGDRPFDDAVSKSKLSGPMPRISHMLVLTDKAQLNSELVELVKSSYQRSH